jgi:cytidylate kinase
MSKPSVIAIDGPAASGKTTLACELARRLGYLYFDTGVMYRAVTLAALERGIPLTDEEAVTGVAENIEIDVLPPTVDDGRLNTVLMNGRDVTWLLHTAEVDANVSIPSAYAGVRQAMTRQQRRIAERGYVVMVGRDIGTVVAPDAGLKVYLDASLEARARRRWREYQVAGQSVSFEEILTAMRQRDKLDSARAVSPLRPAEDAVVLDTTNMDAQAVLDYVLKLVNARDGDSQRGKP